MSDGFNYGGEIAEVEQHFKVWPKFGNKIAVVDADLLPYQIGYSIAAHYALMYTQAVFSVEQGYFKELRETPQYEEAFQMMCKELNSWVVSAGCDSAVLFCTNSASNYRLDLAFTEDYKGQRTTEKPPFFEELKFDLVNRLGAYMSDGNEADDEISIFIHTQAREQGCEAGDEFHREVCNTVCCSSDKDSTITGGWHYDPRKGVLRFHDRLGALEPKTKVKEVNDYLKFPLFNGEPVHPDLCKKDGELYYLDGKVCDHFARGKNAGQPKTKRMTVGKRQSVSIEDLKGYGLKFFYAQLIMGDNADNYSGLSGRGATYAYELLDKCKSEEELYMAVLGAYRETYGTGKHLVKNFRGGSAMLTAYQRMLEQGRLAWMQTERGEIWRSKHYCPTGVEDVWN